jgi:hypothetical protein
MTKEERRAAYLDGFETGARWAETDLRLGHPRISDQYRGAATISWEARVLGPAHEANAAYDLGIARGYRLTLARWDAGELTRAMIC